MSLLGACDILLSTVKQTTHIGIYCLFIKSFFKQTCVTLSGLCGSINVPMMPKLPKSFDEKMSARAQQRKMYFNNIS